MKMKNSASKYTFILEASKVQIVCNIHRWGCYLRRSLGTDGIDKDSIQ